MDRGQFDITALFFYKKFKKIIGLSKTFFPCNNEYIHRRAERDHSNDETKGTAGADADQQGKTVGQTCRRQVDSAILQRNICLCVPADWGQRAGYGFDPGDFPGGTSVH